MDSVDMKNAARLIKAGCSVSLCRKCVFGRKGGEECELNLCPEDWKIDDAEDKDEED